MERRHRPSEDRVGKAVDEKEGQTKKRNGKGVARTVSSSGSPGQRHPPQVFSPNPFAHRNKRQVVLHPTPLTRTLPSPTSSIPFLPFTTAATNETPPGHSSSGDGGHAEPDELGHPRQTSFPTRTSDILVVTFPSALFSSPFNPHTITVKPLFPRPSLPTPIYPPPDP